MDLNSLVVIETPVAINSTLEVGDIVNHTQSNRNGVVYLVENSLVHVRFWDGGKHTFSVEGNDFKIMRKD